MVTELACQVGPSQYYRFASSRRRTSVTMSPRVPFARYGTISEPYQNFNDFACLHRRRIQNRTKICTISPVYTAKMNSEPYQNLHDFACLHRKDEFRTVPKFARFRLFTPQRQIQSRTKTCTILPVYSAKTNSELYQNLHDFACLQRKDEFRAVPKFARFRLFTAQRRIQSRTKICTISPVYTAKTNSEPYQNLHGFACLRRIQSRIKICTISPVYTAKTNSELYQNLHSSAV